MTKQNDGGPAFPHDKYQRRTVDGETMWGTFAHGGMTLRDYFAAMAMMGTVNHPEAPQFSTAAKMAYEMADEMIKARDAK